MAKGSDFDPEEYLNSGKASAASGFFKDSDEKSDYSKASSSDLYTGSDDKADMSKEAEKILNSDFHHAEASAKEYSSKRLIIILVAMALIMVVVAIVSDVFVSGYSKKEEKVEVSPITISSQNLKNGVWDTIITNTIYGQNFSPALTFDKVDGAKCYAIYMIDPDGNDWLHWKTVVTDTDLALGADRVNYVGPYPPSGTHTYNVYVYALKENVDAASLPGDLDLPKADEEKIRKSLDKDYGIISSGEISGTYTSGTK